MAENCLVSEGETMWFIRKQYFQGCQVESKLGQTANKCDTSGTFFFLVSCQYILAHWAHWAKINWQLIWKKKVPDLSLVASLAQFGSTWHPCVCISPQRDVHHTNSTQRNRRNRWYVLDVFSLFYIFLFGQFLVSFLFTAQKDKLYYTF